MSLYYKLVTGTGWCWWCYKKSSPCCVI